MFPDAFSRFLERPVPIFLHLAAASEQGRPPVCCRGYAVQADPLNNRLWVYIMRRQWQRLRGSMQPGHRLSVLLTSGVDNESYQVKGSYCGYRPLAKEDVLQLKRRYELTLQHFPKLAPLHAVQAGDCFAAGLEAAAFYVQTPGPLAGSVVAERSGE